MKCPICGKYMRTMNTHLNYIIWKCSGCGLKEILWRGADPWRKKKEADEAIELLDSEEFGCYLAEVMEAVLEGKILVGVEQ